MTDPIITTSHLSFHYGNVPILDDVNIEIFANEFIGIIGPNGGGKSTLLKLLLGFLKPTKGTITISGVSPKKARQRMAYVPQSLHSDKQFPITVKEVVLGGCIGNTSWLGLFKQEDKIRMEEILEKMNLTDFAHTPFGSLSGGQVQKALIARALVSKPEILLLDEPTANVDKQAEEEIYRILASLQGSITVLMVTHQLEKSIRHMQRFFCIQQQVKSLAPKEVCKHFSMGIYHDPLL